MGRIDRDSRRELPFPGRVLARELWSRTRVALGPKGQRFDWRAAFGRDALHVVDLGCGNGRYLVGSALARPDVDHLGIELVPPAVRLGSLRAGQRGLTNCKFAWGDASEFILERAEPGSLDEVHLYHPQPYYDARKVERRQLTPEILAAIHRSLRRGGLFVFQTDNPAYMQYARQTVPHLFEWRELDGEWPDQPQGRTLREIVARSRGLAILRAEARRRDLGEAEVAARTASMPQPDFDANRARFAGGKRHKRGGVRERARRELERRKRDSRD